MARKEVPTFSSTEHRAKSKEHRIRTLCAVPCAPCFRSWPEEAEFWDTHDAIEVLGEEGWERTPAGTTQVRSVDQTAVGKRAGTVRIPDKLLETVGLKKGKAVRIWAEEGRLVLEPA